MDTFKTQLLFLFAYATLPLFGNAQIIEDDFDYYTLGDMGIQNPIIWTTWTGIPDDGTNLLIVDDFTPPSGSTQQAYIGPNLNQNALFLLGNLTAGEYNLVLSMRIPSGRTASFNLQGTTEENPSTGYQGAGNGGNGVFNSDTLFFDGTEGVPNEGLFTDFTTGDTGQFPLDEFFIFHIEFNLTNVSYQIKPSSIGMTIDAAPVTFQEDATLGAISLGYTDPDTEYWIDWVLFTEPPIISVDDFSTKNLKLYPNPVSDVLNIQSASVISNIVVSTILGEQVMQARPNAISPSLDMSHISSGLYLVTVTIDDNSKTFKIVK